MMGLVTGCETTSHRNFGDARIYKTDDRKSLFPEPFPTYRVELPKISLACETSYVFQVSTPVYITNSEAADLIPELTNYCVPRMLYMELTTSNLDRLWGFKGAGVLPWQDTVLILNVNTPDGKTVYTNSFQLARLQWGADVRDWGGTVYTRLPGMRKALQGLANYKIIMTVKNPSLSKRDFIQLRCPEWDRMIEQIIGPDGTTNMLNP